MYRALIERQKAQRRVLRSVLARFFGGSAEDLVLRLIEDERITPEQLEELRRGAHADERAKARRQSRRRKEQGEGRAVMIELIGSAFPGANRSFDRGGFGPQGDDCPLAGLCGPRAPGRRRALARSALWNATLVGSSSFPSPASRCRAFPLQYYPRILPAQAPRLIHEGPPVDGSLRARRHADAGRPGGDFRRQADRAGSRSGAASGGAGTGTRSRNRRARFGDLPGGCLSLFAIRLAASVLAVRRLKNRCKIVHAAAWTGSLVRTQAMLGISRSVGIVTSPSISIPMVVGWLRR